MKCSQCGKPAVVRLGGKGHPLCVDCNLKFEQAQSLEFDRLARQYNLAVGQIEATVGFPGTLPRFAPPPQRVYHLGDTTLNNIRIDRSAIGILNTGTIGAVDGAITVLRQHGEEDAARAITLLTEAVMQENALKAEQKNEVLEMLSLISAEATSPKEQRRSLAIKKVLLEVSTLLGGVSGLAQLWERVCPLISALFS